VVSFEQRSKHARLPPIADVGSSTDCALVPQVFADLDALAHALRERLRAAAIIGIDGWTGSGKTTLSKALAARMGGATFDLDKALTRDQRRYVTAIRLDEVAEALSHANQLMFVSGICLRQVLKDAGCAASVYIYVKRMAAWGWADEDELVPGLIPEVRGASGELVREELRSYHERWKPHLQADFEFQRPG